MNLRKSAISAIAAGAMVAAFATPASATHEIGHAIAGGIIGGIIGGAIANSQPRYQQPAPVYVQPRPVYVQPRCRWQNVRVQDGYGGWYWARQQVCY